jgi:hypothetical protein
MDNFKSRVKTRSQRYQNFGIITKIDHTNRQPAQKIQQFNKHTKPRSVIEKSKIR